MRQRSSAARSIGASANNRRTRASLALYTELLRLRNTHRALGATEETSIEAAAIDEATIAMRRNDGGERFLVVVRLARRRNLDASRCDEAAVPAVVLVHRRVAVTRAIRAPIEISAGGRQVLVTFRRPGRSH